MAWPNCHRQIRLMLRPTHISITTAVRTNKKLNKTVITQVRFHRSRQVSSLATDPRISKVDDWTVITCFVSHTWTFSRISCSKSLVGTAEVRTCSKQDTLGWILRQPRTKKSKHSPCIQVMIDQTDSDCGNSAAPETKTTWREQLGQQFDTAGTSEWSVHPFPRHYHSFLTSGRYDGPDAPALRTNCCLNRAGHTHTQPGTGPAQFFDGSATIVVWETFASIKPTEMETASWTCTTNLP